MSDPISDAGLDQAIDSVRDLLSERSEGDPDRWRMLYTQELVEHARDHLDEVESDLLSIDFDTGHQSAAHLAARALMLLQRAIDGD